MKDNDPISRRNFFGGVGMTAGALTALGASLPMLGASATSQAAVARTYAGAGLALEFDGALAGFISGAEGGGFAYAKVRENNGANTTLLTHRVGDPGPLPITLSFSGESRPRRSTGSPPAMFRPRTRM
jgi:hypothetical protein